MYVYIHSEWPGKDGCCIANLWAVGFYKPDGRFEPESDHSNSEAAAKRVHYLNGGKGGTPDA